MPRCADATQHLKRAPLVMGILNVTPDSFSDGGKYTSTETAAGRCAEMLHDGADIIDVGPESTRPGAASVDADEQIRRAVPVIERIRADHPHALISIDTRLAPVARAALDAGATIVNDVSALRGDEEMARLVANRGAKVVLMHMRGTPATMQNAPRYDDVVSEVLVFLVERAKAAEAGGVSPDRIMIDPGIGFGKTTEHNIALMRNLERFVDTGYAVLLGASRKRFLGEINAGSASRTGDGDTQGRSAFAGGSAQPEGCGSVVGVPRSSLASERLGGSLACVARAVEAEVHVVRVHDVFETRQLINTMRALQS